MQTFKADLHIHTLLSPCGSLEMSPNNIVAEALKKKLDIIAITDHNSTKQALLVKKLAEKEGLFVIMGAEVNSSEEIHCITLFETHDQLLEFQNFIDNHITPIPNKPEIFGEQIVVDENEMIIEEEKYLLINALDATLAEIEKKAHSLGGLVIPAHVDRPFNGLFSQLGFLPEDLKVDAFEISKNANIDEWLTNGKLPVNSTLLRSSDAHIPDQIGDCYSVFNIENLSFNELRMAMLKQKGRRVIDIACN